MKRALAHNLAVALVAMTGLAAHASDQARYPDVAHALFAERQAELRLLGDRGSNLKSLRDNVFSSSFASIDNCHLDSDGDGLPDCVETGTGVFVDMFDTGTDPFNWDTDGDGISDGDEVMGTLGGLDLPAMGVNPLRKDLLLEYDWFEDDHECAAHSHRPSDAVLARVKAVFAAAPVTNPDGSTGINVIQDVGQGGVFAGGNLVDGYSANLPGALDSTFHQIKRDNFAPERLGYFRYVLMVHRYRTSSGSSGFAEVIGDDAIVSLYCVGSEDNVARTIVHEVGHLLGLRHGGFENCNGKPNYNSLMNYRYQFRGLDDTCNGIGDRRTDGLSSGERLPLDELSVDEFQGMCGSPAIDWDGNGILEAGYVRDLNPGQQNTCGNHEHSTLHDFDDWAHVTLLGVLDASGALKSIQDESACQGPPEH